MLARLARGCIAMAFTASVPADQSSHRLADAAKGGELSYMAPAMEREQTAYRSLPMVAGVALADPQPMLARLIRGCIAMAFTASVATDQPNNHLTHTAVYPWCGCGCMHIAVGCEHTAYSSLLRRLTCTFTRPIPDRSQLASCAVGSP